MTKDHLARVVVKNRRHGAANPDAMYQKETTVEEVLASRVVCEPLHLFMLCSPNEGAAALVLRRADLAPVRRHAGRRRAALAHPRLGPERVHARWPAWPTTTCRPRRRSPPPTPTRRPASAPSDLHVVECQDTDAARELGSCEELGLCEPGGSAALLDSGATTLGGRLPVNPSGGLLSKGEPLGASALGQVVELVRQLRGECGPRQVEGARVALSHTVGRGANAGVVILTR